MPSTGAFHACLLGSDGSVIARGNHAGAKCDIPELEVGEKYVSVSVGGLITVLLRSNGSIAVCGLVETLPGVRQYMPPIFVPGVTYTQISAGDDHWAAICSDGTAYATDGGQNAWGRCTVPRLPAGVTYTQVAAGGGHTVLLRSDGGVLAIGADESGQCRIPELPADLIYTGIAAGWCSTGLILSDGMAIIVDDETDLYGSGVPALIDGECYVEIACGYQHVALLRNDGIALAIGQNMGGQCDIPVLPEGATYTQVSANGNATLLLRSDGVVVALGSEEGYRFDFPIFPPNVHAVPIPRTPRDFVVQLQFEVVSLGDGWSDIAQATCRNVGGHVLASWEVTNPMAQVHASVRLQLQPTWCRIQVVLPDQRLLNATATWFDLRHYLRDAGLD